MIEFVQRRKIEVFVDAPLVQSIVDLAVDAGVTGYTVIPALGGAGRSGRWTDDQVSGAEAKVLFVTVTSHTSAAAFIEALTPNLESHGMMLCATTVDVVRGEKF